MALTKFNSVGGFSVGEDASIANVIDEYGNVTASTLVVSGTSDLGAVGNITITGGATGQFLRTDGSGGLSWATANGGGGGGGNVTSQPSITFTANANANNQSFTDSNLAAFTSNLYSSVFKNGVLVNAAEYTIVGNSLTITSYVQNNDIITVAPVTGPVPDPAGSNTQIQFNNAGAFGASAALKFNNTSNTLTVLGSIVSANANLGNTASANYVTGTLTTAAQPNITSIGNLTSLNVNGAANLGAVGNIKITGGTANYVLKTDGAGNLSWTAQTGGGGSGSSISNGNSNLAIYDSNLQLKLGNISNVLYAEAYQFGANWYTSTVTANANIAITSTTTGPNSYGGFLTVDKGITAQYITANSSISAATYLGVFASSSNAQPNIKSVGTLVSLGVTGDILVYTGNITTNSGNITSGNAINAKGFYGYGQDTIDFKVSNSGMSVTGGGGQNAEVRLQAVDGANGGQGILINKTTLTSGLNLALSGSNLSFGNIGNVKILGGVTGQFITTDGNGNLSFGASTLMANGNSNITIAANSDITMSVGGTANVLKLTTTDANVIGNLNVLGAATFSNGLKGTLFDGNSSIRIVSPNGVAAINVGGTSNVLLVTSTGANITGTLNATGVITGNGSGLSAIAGGNVTGTVANATYAVTAGTANSVAGANVTGTVANSTYAISAGSATSATTADTVTTAAQPNITSVGTLTGLTVNGTSNLGAVGNLVITGGTANYVLKTDGAGNLSWTAQTGGGSGTSIANGNSNVNIATSNGNITMSVAGNANIVTVTGTGANVAGTVNITGVANVGGNLNVVGNAAFTGANVSLGDVANIHVTGGANGYVMSTDGSGNVSFIQSGYSVAQYLSVGRSSNQTIASGNWSSRDVIFNQINQQLNIPYDTSTGLANLTANVTYRITAALAWNAGTSYFYPFAIYDSNNNQISQLFEAFPPAFNGTNFTSGVVDFIYTPTVNTRIKTRTQTLTASTGEWIRGAGPTGIATYMTIQAVAAPFVSTGATGMDYIQVKNAADLSVTANANIVFNTVTGNLGTTLYDTATGNFTLKANTTYRLLSGQAQLNTGQWFPFSWKWASNGNHVVSNINGLSSTTFPGAGTNEIIVTVGTSDANVQLRVDGNNSGTIRANSGWAIAQAIGGQATTTNLSLLGNLTIGGTTWQPGTWTANTAWTLGAVTTAPTFATTNNRRLTWKIEGKTMYINGFYRHTSATGAAAGSGEYLLTLPSGYQVDTTVTGTAASGTAFGLPVGTFNFSKTGTVGTGGSAIVYDSTRVKFIFSTQSSSTTVSTPTTWGSAFNDVTSGAAMDASFVLQIPIL